MGRVISIDWYKVSALSKTYYDEAASLKKIIEESKAAFEATSEDWKGIDNNNYIVNAGSFIEDLEKEYLYILGWCKFLTKASLKYSDNMEEAKNRIQVIDEILSGKDNYEL